MGAATFEGRVEIEGVRTFEAGGKAAPVARRQRQFEVTDMEMRVAGAKTAGSFDRQVEIAVPVAVPGDRATGRSDAQAEPVRHRNRQRASAAGDLWGETRRPGVAVVVAAIGREERHRKMRCRNVRRAFEPPGDIDRICARLHPDPLFDDASVKGKPPGRNGAVEVKAFDGQMALGLDGAAPPAIGEQRPCRRR